MRLRRTPTTWNQTCVIVLPCPTAPRQWEILRRVLETEVGASNEVTFIRALCFVSVGDSAHEVCERCITCGRFLLRFENRAGFVGAFRKLPPPVHGLNSDLRFR